MKVVLVSLLCRETSFFTYASIETRYLRLRLVGLYVMHKRLSIAVFNIPFQN